MSVKDIASVLALSRSTPFHSKPRQTTDVAEAAIIAAIMRKAIASVNKEAGLNFPLRREKPHWSYQLATTMAAVIRNPHLIGERP
eukprot:2144473-Amphidinium_carterae.1